MSDGMGSGIDAAKESGMVVELLEQFLESGFSDETAAKLVNSALVLKRKDDMFSTVDLCTIDLYTGMCRFLKAGAATTFIKRDQWVEAISSTSMALGMVDQVDFETASRKLSCDTAELLKKLKISTPGVNVDICGLYYH